MKRHSYPTFRYLNRPSKVEAISWARISPTSAVAIVSQWIDAVALHFQTILLGFTMLLILDFMPVVLGFLLNQRLFREICSALR